MKSILVGLCVMALETAIAQAVVVTGHAYLDGLSNHSGIRIVFTAVAPPAETDSAATNASGYFSKHLSAGTYEIRYRYPGYAPYVIPERALITNTVLPTQTLYPPLSGWLSDSVGPGTFHVTDSIAVATDAVVTILPGTRILFDRGCMFTVRGRLQAIGTEQDSITFSWRTADAGNRWGGIRLIYAHDSTRLEYCIIEHAASPGESWDHSGGGILIYFCNPTLVRCTVRSNHSSTTTHGGGGICCMWANATIDSCLITGNTVSATAERNGGGVSCSGGAPTFIGCTISQNGSDRDGGGVFTDNGSAALFVDCDVRGNAADSSGGGIAAHSNAVFRTCRIHENNARRGGGAVTLIGPTFTRCEFFDNYAERGGALYGGNGHGMLSQCTLANNAAGIADAGYFDHTQLEINSCILAGDGAPQLLHFKESPDARLSYCDLFTGDSALFSVETDSSEVPDRLGLLLGVNANNDSCDSYFNLRAAPEFVNDSTRDYHLLVTSLCIDAGDPQLPADPDGTVADIGAFYFNQLGADDSFILPPSSFILSAYPNPFNGETRIVFDLPRTGEVKLTIYDGLGRHVKTLIQGIEASGRNEVIWKADAAPSGIYYCHLLAGGQKQTWKLVLLK